MKNKGIALVLSLVLLVSVFGGFASASAESEPVTLTFWNGFTSTDGDVLQEIVNRYNETNTLGVTIEMDIMPWATFNEKLPAAIAANQAPDFVLCSSGYYPPYVDADSFQDMSDFFAATGTSEEAFDENVLKELHYGDLLVGIPMQMISHYLFWDKDLFAAAGLDPETPPTSFEQIKEYAAKLTDLSKNQYGWLIPTNNNVSAQYAMYAFGADYTTEDGKTAALNTPEAVKAFEWMYDVYVNLKASPTDTDDNTYISGQLGMFINGPWIINGLRENEINFGVVAVPAAEGNDPGAAIIPVGFSVPVTTSDEHKALVYDFVRYWNTEEICTEWTQRCGTPAYLKSAEANFADDPINSALSVPLSYGKVVLKDIGVSSVASEALYPALEEIFAGADIQTTLDKYNDVIQGILDAKYN